MKNKKEMKNMKIKRIGYAKIMRGRLIMDLNQPFPIYETKKEAEEAIKESETMLFGTKCLYKDFRSPYEIKEVRFYFPPT
jgi:hypothetical protein